MVHTINQQRGYAFENMLVKNFNQGDWMARRLGGSSVGLPDIIAVNNKESLLFAIEAKSTTKDNAYVPQEEIMRCHDITKMFSIYETKVVALAFRFPRMPGRKAVYYMFLVEGLDDEGGDLAPTDITSVTCNYGGMVRINKRDGSVIKNQLTSEKDSS